MGFNPILMQDNSELETNLAGFPLTWKVGNVWEDKRKIMGYFSLFVMRNNPNEKTLSERANTASWL